MQIRQRIVWRSQRCNETTIGTANSAQGAALECQSGCFDIIILGVDAYCTDISVPADYWNAGEVAYTYNFGRFRSQTQPLGYF